MKRRLLFTLAVLFALITCSFVIDKTFKESKREKSIEVESLEKTRLEELKETLLSSNEFSNSSISLDEEKQLARIDDTYDVYVKSGSYMMNIQDAKQEDVYCEIVDAIEQGLGVLPGKSIDTCKKTLKGIINLGGISAEIRDEYTVLTVVSNEPSTLYDESSTHKAGELISTDKLNYNISIDDYLLTSMSAKLDSNAKTYNVCGHIYHPKTKAKNEFVLKIYDENKNNIGEKNYKYENDTKKYMSFCIGFDIEIDNVKYYSIEKK